MASTASATPDMRQLRFSLPLLVASVVLLVLGFGGCSSADSRAAFEEDAGSVDPGEKPAPKTTKDAGDAKATEPNPDEAGKPEIDSVTPNKATVGSVGPSIIVAGNNFAPRSIVQLDGAPLATSFVSTTELRATIPSSKLTSVGSLRISVGTAPPGGGASEDVTFTVENPAPQLTGLSPLSVVAGAGATQLDVTGDAFVDGAKIFFGTTELATTFTSKSQLVGTVPSNLLVTSGSYPVKVTNPTPGGGSSTTISFTVSNPSATITSISPTSAVIGSGTVTLTVNGTGFVASSAVLFNGSLLTTTFSNATKLTAQVTAASLTTAGDFPVAVQNQPPGGGVSAPTVFEVRYPLPTATSVTPSTVAVGAGPTEITVTGTGFSSMSQITFDGAPTSTTLVSGTQVKTTLSASLLAAAGSHSVRVVNPSPGGGTSAAVAFTVSNGAPTITALNPASVTAGAGDTVVTITGTGFLATSVVKSNNQTIGSTFVSATQLTATVPSSHLLNPGNVAVTITNPPPGGGTSGARNLVVGCDTSGVSFPLSTIGTTTTVNTSFNATGLMSTWNAGGSCTTVTLNASVQQPGRYFVVQNNTGTPIVLSAWADCTTITNGDAFLTFYRRPTVPANDVDRLGCAFVVSEGTNGPGGYASPEAGGSLYCPGLTKANGGGLSLGVCEKAVVHMQPWDYQSTSYPPPPRIKLRPEAP